MSVVDIEIDEMNEITFDFEEHKQNATIEYMKIQPVYEAFSMALRSIIENCLTEGKIYFHSIEARSKTIISFGEKASKPSYENPNRPKYVEPLKEIQDLAGVRVITFFTKSIEEVEKIIHKEFEILERSDKSELLDEKLGYQSIHYLIKLNSNRCNLHEYARFNDLTAELQVRTIMQHAWAEIEHDIQYKSEVAIPKTIRRRFMDLAGLLEIADREFQSIQDEDVRLRQESREKVEQGRLSEVEITPDALRQYLDKKFGQDGRITDFSYSYEARLLNQLGFVNFKQIDDCIHNFHPDLVSRILWGTRQGQLTKLEDTILAGLGENIKEIHPYSKGDNAQFWLDLWDKRLQSLKKGGVEPGNYRPNKE